VQMKAREVLRDGDMGTDTLAEHINNLLKHGTTVSELGNILKGNPEFSLVRKEKRISSLGCKGGSYLVCLWHLKT